MYSWKTVLITIGLLFTLKIWNPMFIENISWSWFDYLHSTHSVEEYNPDSGLPEIVLVDIDEKSVEEFGQLPFPRKIYADKLLESPWTNTYVFTQVFSEPDRFGGDEEFATALVNRLSILASAPTIQTEKGSSPFVGTSTLGSGNPKNAVWGTPGVLSPIPILEGNTYGVGVTTATPSISGTPNFDGTIRSAPLLMQANGQIYPSLAVEVLRAFNDEKSYQMKVTEEVGVEWVRVGRQPPIATTPQGDLMISYWNKFKRYSFTDELPENAILVFGVTAEGWINPVSTPMGVMYPHEVHANLIQTALIGTHIKQSYFLEFVETVLLLSVLLIVLVMVYKLPTALSGTFFLGLLGLQVGWSFYIWSSSLVLFDTFFSSLASLIVFGHASFNKY